MKIRMLAAALLLLPVAATLHAQDATHAHGHRGGGMERMDTDKDGRISRAEFDVGQKHRIDFDAADANKDGYLVRTELRAYHEKMRPQREAERAKRFDEKFAAADLNRDGKLSRVEVDEKMPRMKDHFAWVDENRDGFLSRAELQAGRRQR
jgi:Ca2+-binding EF-hand superfamily protein